MKLDFSRIQCLAEAFEDALWTRSSAVALIEVDRRRESGRWSYAELRREATSFASALRADGFEPGMRLAILAQNQARWIISGIGGFWAGAVLMPIDYKLTAPEQAALLRHGKPNVLIVDEPRWMSLSKEELPSGLKVRVIGRVVAATQGDIQVRDWAERPEPGLGLKIHKAGRDDVAAIVYSSGTGGRPKGCQLTHGNYLAQAEVLGQMFPMKEDQRYFSVLPTNHAIDFMCGFVLPLQFGAAIVHQMTLRPEFLASTMRSYGITHMALVPMLLKALERRIRERLDKLEGWKRSLVDGLIRANEALTARKPKPELSRKLLPQIHEAFGGKLEMLFCGGAFVDRDSAEFFYSLGLPVVIGYGLTEAGTVLTVNDLSPFRGDTVGRVIDNTELELRDRDSEGVGEVWVRGPTVMKGYLDDPDLTSETIVDGWLKTGDLGKVDAAGHLKLLGRAKNMIVTEGGKNVYPEDIESAFDDLPEGIEEVCVFAANYIWPRREMTGEKLVIVLRPKGELGATEIAELERRNRALADYKRLSAFVSWTEEFPRTASMKVKRQVLAEKLRGALARDEALQTLAGA